jgi:hypothetical protein
MQRVCIGLLLAASLTIAPHAHAQRGVWGYDTEKKAASVRFSGGSLTVLCYQGALKIRVSTGRALNQGAAPTRTVFIKIDQKAFNYDWAFSGHTATLTNPTIVPGLVEAMGAGSAMTVGLANSGGEMRNYPVRLTRSREMIGKVRERCVA